MRCRPTILALTFAIGLPAIARAQRASNSETGAQLNAAARIDLTRADPGGYSGESPDDPNRGQTSVAATLMLETHHTGLGRGWDTALVFDAGFQPLFVMVNAPSWPAARPAFIDGLLTAAGARIAHASAATETAIVLRVGTSRLSSKSTVVGDAARAERATIAANDIAEWAFFFDGGVEFRWFRRSAGDAHRSRQLLDPLLRVSGGARHDQRFHREGDLAGYKDPTGRVFFGAETLPIRFGQRDNGRLHLSIGGGFAFESALRTTQRLPSGFRAFVAANLDLTDVLH